MSDNANRVPSGVPTGGQFAASVRGESDVSLTGTTGAVEVDPREMTREHMLADPDLRHIPDAWVSAKSNYELATMLTEMRAARLRAEDEAAEARAEAAAEKARRRSYRRPEWLTMTKDRDGSRRYSTVDGYEAREVVTYADGRARLAYRVNGPGADGSYTSETVERVEEVANWIEDRRSERAGTWREAFPMVSPASRVAEFRGKPVNTWLPSGSYIASGGGYVGISGDDEPTGHVFVDGVFADGTDFDGGCFDSPEAARRAAVEVLTAGPEAYRREQGN